MKGFEEGQGRVKVIVNLAEPAETKARTDWHSKHSLKLLQDEIKAIQTPVLSALNEGEFKLRYRFDNQAGFSGEVTLQGLEKLKNDPRVISVEPVYLLEPHLRQGISLVHADTYRSSYNGAGIAIAICDTGIDYRHPMLGNGGFPNNKVIGGYDYGDSDADPMPDSTQAHGTCCAGIAAGDLGNVGDYIGGVAYNAKLYALKITPGSDGSASSDAMVAAWNWCVTHRNDNPAYPILVISTSFGGGRNYSTCDSSDSSMTIAANNAVAAGITVLASSGNDGYCDSIAWPSCISSVISVGAVYDAGFGTYLPCINAASCATKYSGGCSTGYYAIDNTAADVVTSYSNTASFLTVLAPSNQCYTTDIIGSAGYSSGDYYSSFGGTSAACPYTAGVVACLQSAAKTIRGSYLFPSEVRTILTSTGDNITDGKVAITKPRINLEQAINNLFIGSPPTANSINVTTPLNTAITIAFQATDDGLPNPPGDLSYIITSLPSHGTLSDPDAGGITAVPYTVVGNGNQVVYTPTTGYSGSDSFQFKANDGGTPPEGGDSNTATVSISVVDTIYMANMDTNPGWTLDSLWQWGTPTGSGGQHGNHDPTAGYTGAKVVGYNLLGDYENSITSTRWAKTPAINCTNRTGVTLTFYRWLNVEQPAYDHAYIQVSNNGSSWSTIWQNSSEITDSSWTLQTFDISAIADNQPTVYIRWGMGTTDSSWQYSGWNIDDVKITGIVGSLLPQPPVTQTGSASTQINTSIPITLVATDDGLPNPPGALTYIITSLPSNGVLSDPSNGVISSVPYSLLGYGNQVIYTPDVSFTGSDSFQFKANDGGTSPEGGDSNIATVSITVNPRRSTIFSEDFESGIGSFTIDNTFGDGSGLWHLTTTCNSILSGHSTPTSLYYGQNSTCNYDAGQTEGIVTSSVISLAGASVILLEFNYMLETEQFSGFDVASVEVSENGGDFIEYLSNTAGTLQDSSGGWVPKTLDLSSMAGSNVQIRFRFRTVDNVYNTYPGFYVDDVNVTGIISILQRTLSISSTAGGHTEPNEGDHQYNDGTVVDVNAIPNPNYHFVNWTGTAVTAGKVANPNSPSTTVLMDANYTVQANFAIDQRSLTTSASSGGTVTTPGIGTYWYDYNTPASIVASANDNYHFVNWTGDTDTIADVNAPLTTITMDANYAIQANFALTGVAPVITSTPVLSAIVNQLYSYDVNATGIPEPNYSLITSPAGMTINTSTGLISWTPDANQIGDVNVTVEAFNVAGTNQQSFTIMVSGGVVYISGYVIEPDGNTPVVGVLVDANSIGGSPDVNDAITDPNGYYEMAMPYNWSGTVTPAKEGYTFEPNGISYGNVVINEANDYTATLMTFKISGHVLEQDSNAPINDVNVLAENGGGQWTNRYGGGSGITDVNGYYKVVVDYNWSGKVMPTKYAYGFTPTNIDYNNVVADQNNQDYAGKLLTFVISGYIRNECNVPINGVLVDANNGGGQDTTDVNGFYEVWVDYNWFGTVTPSKAYYTFEPNSKAYTNVLEGKTGQGYLADNIYDLDCDGLISWGDVSVMTDNWLDDTVGNICDFNADAIVNFRDYTEFANVWLTEQGE
jgi:hypothetical protein